MIEVNDHNGVRTLTFMHAKPQNPFGDHMQDLLFARLDEAEDDDNVRCIVLTGGHDRSFCVGGDFSEIVDMETSYEQVDRLIGKIIRLYNHVLNVTKPVVAAVDHYAIGLGFQIALLADYRIGSDRAKFRMPEVKNGVACSLGGVLIEHLINRYEMMRICYECDMLPLDYCVKSGILHEIVPHDRMLDRAQEKGEQFAAYSPVSFRNTKRVNNDRFVRAIDKDTQAVIESHHLTFSGKVHRPYMKKILKRD